MSTQPIYTLGAPKGKPDLDLFDLKPKPTITFDGGGICPEQYDAYLGDELVGYLRMRHGTFAIHCPNVAGEQIIYSTLPKGDGCFEDDEREFFLGLAQSVILRWLDQQTEVSS